MLEKIISHQCAIVKTCGCYKFCKSKTNVTFPYVLNRQEKYPYNEKIQQASKVNIETIFGRQISQNFIAAYRSYLEALEDNDVDFLKSIVAKELLQGWKATKTKLQNRDSSVNVRFGKSYQLYGVDFERDKHKKCSSHLSRTNQQGNDYFACYLNQNQEVSLKNFPMLYAFEIFFESNMKLVPQTNQNSSTELDQTKQTSSLSQEQKQNQESDRNMHLIKLQRNRSEVHKFQFQFIKYLNLWQFFAFVAKSRIKYLFNSNKYYQVCIRNFFQKGEWKIGDVDGILGGNLSLLNKK